MGRPNPVNENQPALVIRTFDPGYREAFARLNYEWIKKYFTVEPLDQHILEHPESAIMETGGQIFFALEGERVVGTVALKRDDARTFELTKMAVDESVRGHGIGKALLSTAIAYAREHGAEQIVLSSHTSLTPAISMYRAAGFVERTQDQNSCYSRCNIYMELNLS